MKTNMKKLAAWMLALLLVLQMVPAMAEDNQITSEGYTPEYSMYRDQLKVENDSSIIIAGKPVTMTFTEGYDHLTWESNKPEVATVEDGVVTGIAPGTVKITAREGDFADSIVLKVVVGNEENAGEEIIEGEDIGEETATNVSANETMTIIINIGKDKYVYDGQEHEATFTAVSDAEGFDPDEVQIDSEKIVTAKDCGITKVQYEASDFTYNGSNENAEFVVGEGWIQIKPANVIVKANDTVQKEGEKVEYTATVTGLVEGEDPELIKYTFSTYTAGNVTYITPVCEQNQGNYRVTAQAGILTFEGGIPRIIRLTSDLPEGEPVYEGTMITMKAELTGFEDLDYTLQWQHSVDLQEWIDEPGANDTTYTFELNETTVQYTWRVVADY